MLSVIGRSVARSISLCLLGLLSSLALAYPESVPGEYLDRGKDGCMMCHGPDSGQPIGDLMRTPHGLAADAHAPFGSGQKACESCHGPSADHVGGRTPEGGRPLPGIAFHDTEPAAARDGACLSCHEPDTGHFWAGSAHQFEEVACTDCHQIHSRRDPVLERSTQTRVCTDCHRREHSEFLRPSTHPLNAGNMLCTDCHAPHGSASPGELTRSSVNETCYDCHAEYRGPFLWEHAPVSEDCTSCHTPHGSSHRSLLTRRSPWMCQECHLAQFHPSTAESGTGVPPQGASRQILGRDCLNCHSQVHGSNHPSGMGLVR